MDQKAGIVYLYFNFNSKYIMGKGDQRSKKGKIHIGSYGRLRPRKKATAAAAPKKAAKKAK